MVLPLAGPISLRGMNTELFGSGVNYNMNARAMREAVMNNGVAAMSEWRGVPAGMYKDRYIVGTVPLPGYINRQLTQVAVDQCQDKVPVSSFNMASNKDPWADLCWVKFRPYAGVWSSVALNFPWLQSGAATYQVSLSNGQTDSNKGEAVYCVVNSYPSAFNQGTPTNHLTATIKSGVPNSSLPEWSTTFTVDGVKPYVMLSVQHTLGIVATNSDTMSGGINNLKIKRIG